MHPLVPYVFPALWLAWAACWWALARHVKPTERSESVGSRLKHVVPLLAGSLLLALPTVPMRLLGERWLPRADWPIWVGALLTLAGLLFAVWARVHLGRNWSGIVTVKSDHELITSGPYRLVRHPIYTGLLLAIAGSAMARGEWRGVLAFVLVLWSFQRKMRIEERWMHERFGGAYQAYAERVAPLVPFLR